MPLPARARSREAVLAARAAIKAIVTQQVDPRLAADLKAFDFHKVVDNSNVARLVKEGFFEQLFGADVKAEEQRRAKLAF